MTCGSGEMLQALLAAAWLLRQVKLQVRLQGDSVRLVDTLAHLLDVARRVLLAGGPTNQLPTAPGDEESASWRLRGLLRALRRRLVEATVEDFSLDMSRAQYCLAVPAGLFGQAKAGYLEWAMGDAVEELTSGPGRRQGGLAVCLIATQPFGTPSPASRLLQLSHFASMPVLVSNGIPCC
jgi:hypothetical protein